MELLIAMASAAGAILCLFAAVAVYQDKKQQPRRLELVAAPRKRKPMSGAEEQADIAAARERLAR